MRRVLLRLPSGETCELSGRWRSLGGLRRAVEAATGFPADCQLLLRRGAELRTLPESEGAEVDLVLRVGAYRIASPDAAAHLEEEVFHPAASLERTRVLEELQEHARSVRFSDDRPLRSRVDLTEPTQRADERLEPYRRCADARRGRLAELRAGLEPGPIVAMTFNAPYAALFENWHESCRRNHIDARPRTLLFPMDEEADAVARTLGYATFHEPESYGAYGRDSRVVFGDRQWMDCLFMKNAVMGDLLAAGFDVLFQDVDVVWRRDPLPYLRRRAERERWDFLFQGTGIHTKFQPTYYNSGFVYARSTDFSRVAWEHVLANQLYVYVFHSQQAPLNVMMSVFRAGGLRTTGLPCELFVNGRLLAGLAPAAPVHPEAYVIHVNWTESLAAKLDRLRALGLWYLEGADPEGAE